MPNEPVKEDWHLDKSVSVGHILTTLLMIGAFAAWMLAQSDRITVLEVQQSYSDSAIQEVKANIAVIDDKVDEVLIRLGGPTENGT